MKLRKGDKIKVMTGKDKGKEGTIDRVYAKQNKVMVPQINLVKKNIKKNEQLPQGGVIDIERPIDVSKLMLVCPKCGKTARVGYTVEGNKKTRICRSCKSEI